MTDKILYSPADLDSLPPLRWLIPGWLPANEITVFFGKEGTYKSFLAQGLSLSIAWRTGKTVLYVAAEGVTGLAARVHAWQAVHGIKYPERPSCWLVSPNPIQVFKYGNLSTPVDAFNVEIGLAKPQLVVIDTVARNFVGGDENSARDMGLWIDGIEKIRRLWGTAVLLIHHEGKPGEKGISRGPRGSSALGAAAFAVWRTSDPRRTERGASVTLECEKMKDGEHPDPIRVDLDKMDLDFDEGDVIRSSLAWHKPFQDPRPAKLSSEEQKEARKRDVVELVRENGGKMTGEKFSEIVGKPKKDANRTLHDQASMGRLIKDNDGTYSIP
jgi:hypothetical protein